ncbi:MAG: hypothetical protein AB1649_31965, partial [Chloroflexota bacterium]
MSMARIRSIKPEFWTSPQVVACTIPARLAFVGLLNFCDDNGVHPASASRLRMQVFPEDDIGDDRVKQLVSELISAGLVATYLAGDESFWLVTGWSRHQKIDKPTYRHPIPNGRTGLPLTDEDRRVIIEQSAKELAESLRRIASPNEFVELSRRGSSGTESNGVEGKKTLKPPSQEDDPPASTTEIGGGAPALAQKIPYRRFV